MLKAVLFDMDGTLLDTERALFRIHGERAEKQGLVFTREFYASLMGRDQDLIRQMCEEEFHGAYEWRRHCDEAYQEVIQLAREGKIPLRPGVEKALDELQDMGIRMGLVTSSERYLVNSYIDHIPALQNRFEAMVCGTEAPKLKPEPEPFLLCAEKLGVLPGECAGVEDGAAGLKAITRAGMTSVFVPDLLTLTEELKPFVTYTLPTMSELPGLISRLNAR